MKALLMAAGKGTRISKYLNGNPKCTVDLGNGIPLIRYTVDMLRKKGINDIAMVTGYRHLVIEELLSDKNITFYRNPFFDVTNSIVSAWFAKDFLTDDDVLIMNADVFADEKAYDIMLETDVSPVMLYDTTRREFADYKFFCEDSKIVKYGKELSLEETSGEYVGIAKLKKDFVREFVEKLDFMIDEGNHGVWWENVLYEMVRCGEREVTALDIAPVFWAEVDYIEDYERIKKYVLENLTGQES